MEAAEATQRGVTMQTRLSMCAVSPETHSLLPLEKSRYGEREREQTQGGGREQWCLKACWGLRGCLPSLGLEGKNGGYSGQAEFSSFT